ncbi:hypothetical protein L596_006423 [Steinernema carpocapsae]|uniref:Uncharacterized protein n=1 Tax=Steinernema carpocapsae TaxID=34508 RepID=A0A4U8V8S9_STECR|nr:hypothetical protein L596_006423 [Steinernema carpocapsae]
MEHDCRFLVLASKKKLPLLVLPSDPSLPLHKYGVHSRLAIPVILMSLPQCIRTSVSNCTEYPDKFSSKTYDYT